MMTPVRPDVRAFFRRYERASEDLDSEALTSLFCAVFLSLDASSAATLSPQELLARRFRARSSRTRRVNFVKRLFGFPELRDWLLAAGIHRRGRLRRGRAAADRRSQTDGHRRGSAITARRDGASSRARTHPHPRFGAPTPVLGRSPLPRASS
jgi:hypothetical protein